MKLLFLATLLIFHFHPQSSAHFRSTTCTELSQNRTKAAMCPLAAAAASEWRANLWYREFEMESKWKLQVTLYPFLSLSFSEWHSFPLWLCSWCWRGMWERSLERFSLESSSEWVFASTCCAFIMRRAQEQDGMRCDGRMFEEEMNNVSKLIDFGNEKRLFFSFAWIP